MYEVAARVARTDETEQSSPASNINLLVLVFFRLSVALQVLKHGWNIEGAVFLCF